MARTKIITEQIYRFECSVKIKFQSSLRSNKIMDEKLKSIAEKSIIDNIRFDFSVSDITNAFDPKTFDEVFFFDVVGSCVLSRNDLESSDEVIHFLRNYMNYQLRDFTRYYEVKGFNVDGMKQNTITVERKIFEDDEEENPAEENEAEEIFNPTTNVVQKPKVKEKINSRRRIFIVND